MRTIETKVYNFDELSEDAQQTAIEKLADINMDYPWFDCQYEDAESIGLKIESFDIDRQSIKGQFTNDALFTAKAIIEKHGDVCETYKTAESFLAERDEAIDTAPTDDDGEFEDEYALDGKLDDIEAEFLQSILEDYLILLRQEYEYRGSREAIINTIEANEYEFTEAGKLV